MNQEDRKNGILRQGPHRFFKEVSLFWKSVMVITLVITLLLGLAIVSAKFADWYRAGIFRGIQYIMAHVSALVSISAGEIMIYTGIIMLVLLLAAIIIGCFSNPGCKQIRKYYLRIAVCVLLYVYASETLNCFILYRGETLEKQFIRQGAEYEMITLDSLKNLHQKTVKKLNELSGEFERDSDGYIILTKSRNTDYQNKCREALGNLSGEFPLLKGYYPNVKMIQSSGFMTQQYLLGIYFPFSMEANYNEQAYITNLPATFCHELSHMKGYILEDEANFLAYLACIRSEDAFMKYSGYLSVLGYIERDLLPHLSEEEKTEMVWENKQVLMDDIFVKKEVFEEIEKNALFSTDFISEATDIFLDTNLKLNGVSEGVVSYSQVVKLILLYEQLE